MLWSVTYAMLYVTACVDVKGAGEGAWGNGVIATVCSPPGRFASNECTQGVAKNDPTHKM